MYTRLTQHNTFTNRLARAQVLSLRLAFRINTILIALCVMAIGLYVFFIAQAVFYATARTDIQQANQALASKVALLEQEYLARTSAISPDMAPGLGLVALSDKNFAEKSVVSRAGGTVGVY